MSSFPFWNHCGTKHFEILRQKDIPWVPGKWSCFHGNLETSVSQLANQELPGSQRVRSPTTGAWRFLGNEVLGRSFFIRLKLGDYKYQNSLRSRLEAGLEAAN